MRDPVIETDRLRLRRHRLEDAEHVRALWADPAVVRFIGAPAGGQESWSRLLRYVGHWSLFGYGYFAVEERATGRFIGEVGVAHFRRDGFDEPEDSVEAGWVLAGGCQGQGYGSEAAAALHGWVDRTLAFGRTHCLIDPANAASIRLAQSLGYERRAEVVHGGKSAVLLVRARRA
ncbi:MAG: GNAT family N-acetyltransferase [Thalassobaculaceae bacterium]